VKLARFWARAPGEAAGSGGERVRVVARGWSNASLDEARAKAAQAAARLAARLASGQPPTGAYLYGERPLPEPIVRELGDGGAPRAVVTRNAYGSLVLNARELMFVDIDREPEAGAGGGVGDLVAGVRALFGGRSAKPAVPAGDPVVDEVRAVAERQRLAARVYRTAAGYRAIVTSGPFAAGAATEPLLQQFGADPLYVRLCRLQESFRARLTPKPWRCGASAPPVAFPFETPQAEARFREWEATYRAASARYATCRFLATVGGDRIDPALVDLVAYHDQETRATSGLPLA
jgi:hypothetical protein